MSTTGQTYYAAAREELITRLKFREQLLNWFVITAGLIIGISLLNINGMGNTVALVIPFLGLGTAILITNHTMVITNIARYTQDLDSAINICRELTLRKSILDLENTSFQVEEENKKEIFNSTRMIPWDRSGSYIQQGLWSSWQRLLGNIVVIIIPALFSLYLGFSQIPVLEQERLSLLEQQNISVLKHQEENKSKLVSFDNRLKIHRTLCISGIVLTFLSFIIILYSYMQRIKWVTATKVAGERLTFTRDYYKGRASRAFDKAWKKYDD